MNNIDIIIPVHKYNDDIKNLLARCLTSVKEMAINAQKTDIICDVHIVGPSTLPLEILDIIEWEGIFNLTIEENDGLLDFSSQINFAVKNTCKNDYFMIVEMDDVVTPKWINMSIPYIKERKKCPIFLPLVEVYDITSPKMPLHYINELAWSSSFTEDVLGVLSNALIKDFRNFNITGSIIKRSDFIKAGSFKPSIKLSFCYELLLRLTHFCGDAFVIPKVGYFHFVNREGSLSDEYYKTMSKEEGSWWIDLALEEYQCKIDKNKVYNPDNNN
jgi:hypothetical protein